MDENDQDAAVAILGEIDQGIAILYNRCVAQQALLQEILSAVVKNKRRGLFKELPGSKVRGWVEQYRIINGMAAEETKE